MGCAMFVIVSILVHLAIAGLGFLLGITLNQILVAIVSMLLVLWVAVTS